MKVPTDQQAEISVLGAMMNDHEALLDCIGGLNEDYFTSDDTRALYNLIIDVSVKHNKAPAYLLNKEVSEPKQKVLIQAADSTYINHDAYKVDLEKLENTFLNRQLYYITEKVRKSIEHGSKAKKTIEKISDELNGLFHEDKGTNILDPQVYGQKVLDEFLAGLKNPEQSYGLRFSTTVNGSLVGFPGLDEVFRGAKGGDLFLLAAKTGQGKTALANNLARIFSLYQKHAVYYENTEMKEDELTHRLISPLAWVTVDEIASRILEGTESERKAKQEKIVKAMEHFKSSKLYLSRIPVLTATKAKALAKQVKSKYGHLDCLFIDYIGRMDMENSKGLQEWQVLYKIIQQMKELAMEMDIPIFVLSQRNEEGHIEGAKKIANECDGVLYFEPITDYDKDWIDKRYLQADKRERVNYKIVKKKIRRSSNISPIYCEFDKDKQFINEVV